MSYEINTAEVWAGELEDKPGALADRLTAIERAGSNLDFVIVRPSDSKPGTGVLFVAPLTTVEQKEAASDVGLRRSDSIHALRVTGPDRPGLGAGITGALAVAGVNIAGMSAAAINGRAIFYIRFANEDDLSRAATLLARSLG